MLCRIRNLRKYQHYRNRRPPWIKLPCEILEDHEHASLHDSAWRLSQELVILASRSDSGEVDCSPEALSWVLRRTIKAKDIESLQILGFIEPCKHVASVLLAPCKQLATSETETETETETENTALPKPRAARVNGHEFGEEFKAWWLAYGSAISPRPMRDKPKCWEFWRKEGLEEYGGSLRGKLERQAEARRDAELAKQFCPSLPDPIRYLKRRLWHEELSP